jgi:hypothetical protein
LFEERYNKMRGYKTPASKEEIENYRNHMLSNMQKVDWWPVGFDRDNKKYDTKKYGSAWYDNMFTLEKDKYGVDIVPEDPQSAGLSSGKKSHTIFRSNNYDPTAAIHELSHASTNYYGLPANVNIPFSKNPEKEEYVKRFNTYHNRRNTEKKSYKDELAKYLYDAGIYDATTKRFDENDYENVIKEYEKIKEELKKDPNNKALLEKKKTFERNIEPYDKEQTIQLFNSFVDNTNNKELPIGQKGGEGYRINASGYNDPYKVIPSGNITMTEQDGGPLKKGPLLGIDNMGNQQMMFPGYNYQFPGDMVMEIPVAQTGIESKDAMMKNAIARNTHIPFVKRLTLSQKDSPSLYLGKDEEGYDMYGSHQLASFGNYVLPNIVQDGTTLKQISKDGNFDEIFEYHKNQDFKNGLYFDNPKDAEYFAESNYKRVSPAFKKQKGGSVDEFQRILKKYTTKGWASLTPQEQQFYRETYQRGGSLPRYQSKGEVLTYQDNPEYFDNKAVLGDNIRYSDLVKKRVYAGTHGYNPTTGEMVKLDSPQRGATALDLAYSKKEEDRSKDEQSMVQKQGRRNRAFQDLQALYRNPLFYAPAAIATAGTLGPAVLANPYVNAGLTGLGVYDATTHSIPGAVKATKEGRYLDAAGNTAMASLDLLPIPFFGTNLIGEGKRLGKILTKGPLKNTYKYNPFSNKLHEYNRIVAQDAVQDAMQTNLIRTGKPKNYKKGPGINLDRRGTTPFPSFGKKGKGPDALEAYYNDILKRGNTPYIISTDRAMKLSTLGRHGKGSTMFPVDESGKYLKEFPLSEADIFNYQPHWLKGYQKVKQSEFSPFDYYNEDLLRILDKDPKALEKLGLKSKIGEGYEASVYDFINNQDKLLRIGMTDPENLIKAGEKFWNDKYLGLPISRQAVDNSYATLMNKVPGASLKGMVRNFSGNPNIDQVIPRKAIAEAALKLRELKKKNIYLDWQGDNITYDPITKKIGFYDFDYIPMQNDKLKKLASGDPEYYKLLQDARNVKRKNQENYFTELYNLAENRIIPKKEIGGEFQRLVNKYTSKGWQSLTDQEKQTYKEMYQQYK